MNDSNGGCGGLVWRWRRAGVLAIVACLAVLMAACSSPSPRPSPGAYMACMHEHGVTGAFASPPGMSTSLPAPSRRTAVQIPAKESAAMQACQSLAPRPGQGSGAG